MVHEFSPRRMSSAEIAHSIIEYIWRNEDFWCPILTFDVAAAICRISLRAQSDNQRSQNGTFTAAIATDNQIGALIEIHR